ncbi:MAG: hypothetical protein EOP49_16885, partial [Sphingobacteriales bacterium]
MWRKQHGPWKKAHYPMNMLTCFVEHFKTYFISKTNQMNCNVPALWQEHKEALYYFILKRVHDEPTAKDISQEVLIKVYNFCVTKSGVRNVRSWLFQIAQNAIVDHYRKNKRNIPTETFHDAEEESEVSAMKDAAEFILPMINL